MKKKYRETIYHKFGGRCAYCGEELKPGWHVWDILPIQTVVTEIGELSKVNTEDDNLMPACKECGSVRIKDKSGKMDIEAFRREIVSMYEFVKNHDLKPNKEDHRFPFLLDVSYTQEGKKHLIGCYCFPDGSKADHLFRKVKFLMRGSNITFDP